MKALDYPLLTDENIQFEVVQTLRKKGKQVRTVWDEGLDNRDDAEILQHAHERGWVVLTQDRDFGKLSIRLHNPYIGIVYLRPGHIDSVLVMESLQAIESMPLELAPPFIVVAERKGAVVRVRVRSGVPL
jgi:predicted nuclease of predicted toxin-antitoxin system